MSRSLSNVPSDTGMIRMPGGLLPRILRRCEEKPDQVIVQDGALHVEGHAFLEHAHALHHAFSALGIVPGQRIGICLEPGIDLLVAIAGIWMAGCSFVPFDAKEAPLRLKAMLDDSKVTLVLKQSGAMPWDMEGIAEIFMLGGQLLPVPEGKSPRASDLIKQKPEQGLSSNEAYVIFTSGSTGRPKGVSVSHASIASYVDAACAHYGVPDGGMIFPAHLAPTFDACLTSLLPPLISGNIVMPLRDPVSATRALADCLKRSRAPVLVKTTPRQAALLRDFLTPADVADLSGAIVIGGEALDYADLALFRSNARLTLFNEYGPTEASVGCVVYQIGPDDPWTGSVPIGRPLAGTRLFIEPEGELVIAGAGVANGYINASNDAFFNREGLACYRSGDRVSCDGQGVFHFHGRMDDQVKVNGFRIELGEVEEALRQASPQTSSAALLLDNQLIGVVAGLNAQEREAVFSRLQQSLPAFMQPARLIGVAQIPLSAHGKTDRKRLADMVMALAEPQRVEQADSLAATLAGIWSALLGVERVEADADFFADGGHSITALKLAGRLSSAIGQDVPVGLLFDNPGFSDFLLALRGFLKPPDAGAPADARLLAPCQMDILAAEIARPVCGQFTVVSAVRLSGRFTFDDLHAALVQTISRHDVFSWLFKLDASGDVLATGGNAQNQADVFETYDLRGMQSQDATRLALERLAHWRNQDIALLEGAVPRLLTIQLPALEADSHNAICALIMHHALLDEHACSLFWTEVFDRVRGETVSNKPDRHYADWAADKRSDAAREKAKNLVEPLFARLCALPAWSLSKNAKHHAVPDAQNDLAFDLPAVLVEGIRQKAGAMRVPASAFYGVAAARAFGRLAGTAHFALFMPITLRRTEADFSTIGCFTTSMPVIVENSEQRKEPEEALRRWQKAVAFAIEHAGVDHMALAARLRESVPDWLLRPRFGLAIEQDFIRHAHDMNMHGFTVHAGPAKQDVTIFVKFGQAGQAGQVRIVWRAGALDRGWADHLRACFLEDVRALCNDKALIEPVVFQSEDILDERAILLDPAVVSLPDNLPVSPEDSKAAQAMASLLAEALRVRVQGHDNLFSLKVSSLDLLKIIAAVDRRYGIRLRTTDLFDFPTPAELAMLVSLRSMQLDR